jgi:hypothetical protein
MATAMIETTSDATAFMLTGIATSLNLEEGTWQVDPVQTDLVNILQHSHEPLQLQLPIIEHKSTHSIIIAIGIEFFHETQGRYQPVEKKYNAMAVVKVYADNIY